MPDNLFKDPLWLEQFLSRIERLMVEEGLEDQKDFNEIIGIQRAITRWKTGETSPGLKSCLAIKKTFGKSLDWIIFGEESSLHAKEAAPDFYYARRLPPLNIDLLNLVIATVEGFLQHNKIKILPLKKACVITIFYDDCKKKNKCSEFYFKFNYNTD